MEKERKLVQECQNLQLYFHELITEALQHQNISVDDHLPYYLVNLLTRFTQSDQILRNEENVETPLATLFFKAQNENLENKTQTLKYLGDFSLFTAGYFQDSLNRKLVDLDYYVSMGEGAYSQLSSLTNQTKRQIIFSQIFSNLADHFVQWMDVISEVSETAQLKNQTNLLRLYEKWLRTGSIRIKEKLVKEGIFPDERLNIDFVQ